MDRRTYLAGQALAGMFAAQPGWVANGTSPGTTHDLVSSSFDAASRMLEMLQNNCNHKSKKAEDHWYCVKCGMWE